MSASGLGLRAYRVIGEQIVGADHGVMIYNAKVTLADVEASSGVIHVIDIVLLPP